MGKLFVDAGLIVLSAFISLFRSDRQMVRTLFSAVEFIEVHISTLLNVCEQRDPKGLYKKARTGQIKNFTSIDLIYEIEVDPEIITDTAELSIQDAAQKIYDYLCDHAYL